jgi:hypothetical protein
VNDADIPGIQDSLRNGFGNHVFDINPQCVVSAYAVSYLRKNACAEGSAADVKNR